MTKLRVLAIGACALALSACVVAPYPRQVAYYPESGGPMIVSEVAPPPPYVEAVTVAPFPGAIWIGGYWGWAGGRHNWVPGRWERPRPGYVWSPHRWENRGGHWHLRGGIWLRS